MATWRDVERIALALDGAKPGVAHEGSPTVDVGRHPFARLRWDDEGREMLQFWSLDLGSEQALADRRDTFVAVQTFSVKVSVWARLDRLAVEETGRARHRLVAGAAWRPRSTGHRGPPRCRILVRANLGSAAWTTATWAAAA